MSTAVAQALAKIHNPYGDTYPDNDEIKEVLFQAEGFESELSDRHVLFRWLNGVDNNESNGKLERYTQILQLSGGPGNYAFHHPSVKPQSPHSINANTFYSLGMFTRPQRDLIISLALAVKFKRTSRVNDCRTWARDVLEAMVKANLISQDKLQEIDEGVPLRERVPELAE